MGVTIKGLEFSYANNLVLDNIDISFKEGKVTGIIGNGKTTLLGLISGSLVPKKGKIVMGDIVISPRKKITNITEHNKKCVLMAQFPDEEFFLDTVEKELSVIVEKVDKEIDLVKLLDMVDLDASYLSRDPFSLSNGEIRKLGLAASLIYNPDIILLDEPSPFFDVKKLNTLLTTLKVRYKKTIIIASNDIDFINEISDEVVVLKENKVIFSKDKKKLFKDVKFLTDNNVPVPNIMKFVNYSLDKYDVRLGYRYEINDLVKDILRKLG